MGGERAVAITETKGAWRAGRLVARVFAPLKRRYACSAYINAIYPHREWLQRLHRYAAFSDIEFNPERSVNCQARSCALFVSLMTKSVLDVAVESPQAFIATLVAHAYRPRQAERADQRALTPDEAKWAVGR